MDLVGVIKILLIALIQISSVHDSCQTGQSNVPFKTSFVSSSDYSVRRNVGALISLPLSNIETPHQPEALMSGSSFEPTFSEQTFSASREPISIASSTRDEVSLTPTNQVQSVNVDYQQQQHGEHYGNDQTKRISSSASSASSSNNSQEPVVVVEVQASRQSQQAEEPLINTHYSQVDDLVASPSAEMSHNASHTNQTSNSQTTTISNTTLKPITTTIQSKFETATGTIKQADQKATSTVGPSSSTIQATTLDESISQSSSTTVSTITTTTTTATTTIPTTTTTTTPSSTSTTAGSTSTSESPPTTTNSPSLVTSISATNRSTMINTTQSEVDINTTVMAKPESSTPSISSNESVPKNDSNSRADQVSPQQTSRSASQTTHVPPASPDPSTTTTETRTIGSISRGAKKVKEDTGVNSDRALDQEMFLSNRSSISIHNRNHLCRFGEPNCSYIVATVPVLDRWNSDNNKPSSGQNNNNQTRVVNEFVFVPEDSGLNFEDPSYLTRKLGSKDVETSSLRAEHRTIDNEGETTSSLSDDIELDYTNPDSDTTRGGPFIGKSAAEGISTMTFSTIPTFSTSTTSSSFSPTSSSLAPTTSPFTSQTRLQPTTNTSRISSVKSTSMAPMTTTAAPSLTMKSTTTAPDTTTVAPTTRRPSSLQPSTGSSTFSLIATSSTKPTNHVSQSTSYTVRVSPGRATSIFPQTTPTLRLEEALPQTTRKPVARLNQKILRINDQSAGQLPEMLQPVSRLPVSSATSAPTTAAISTSTPSAPNSAPPTSSASTPSPRVSQSTSSKPVMHYDRVSSQENAQPVRTRVAQQVPLSRRSKASSNSYGEHKHFLSEPIRDLRRKSSSLAGVGSNFSPSFNGADDEETKILTRYTIPSQLSRLTAPKSATETKRSAWSNQRTGVALTSATTNNQQSTRNKLEQASPSEKLAVEQQIPRSSPTTSVPVVPKDQLSIENNSKKHQQQRQQQNGKRLQTQTMTNMLLDDKQLNRQAQASLTVTARATNASNKSDQIGQSQAQASMRVSSFSDSPLSLQFQAKMERFEAPEVGDDHRSFRPQSNQPFLESDLNSSQKLDKQQLPTTTTSTVATTATSKQHLSSTEESPMKRNAGEVITLIASSPDSGSMPAQPVAEKFTTFLSSITSLNGDYREKNELSQQRQQQEQPDKQQYLQHKQHNLRQPDQQVDKIIDLLTSNLAAEKNRGSTTSTSTTMTPTARNVRPTTAKVELSKPVRRLVDEVDDFEGSIEDQLEKDALHSRPHEINLKTTSAPMASKRSNAYTKAPRQNLTKQQQQQATALQVDSGKWVPSAEDAAGSGSDSSESGNNSGNLLPGRPGVDYPIHWQVPKTSFDCRNYELSGFYADIESDCQAYHSCHKGRGGRHTFLCPNGTLFSQELLTCDWWYNVECSASNGAIGSVGTIEQGSRTTANELSMAA